MPLQDPGTTGNRVQGNYIGTDAGGTAALPNAKDGVVIANGASDNLVGGETPGERNLISGNGKIGVNLSRSADYAGDGATANRVLGNYIGTDVTGARRWATGSSGSISASAHTTTWWAVRSPACATSSAGMGAPAF